MGKGKVSLAAAATAVDPALDALFSASSGPVVVPSKSRYSELLPPKELKPRETQEAEADEEEDDEELSEIDEELDDESDEDVDWDDEEADGGEEEDKAEQDDEENADNDGPTNGDLKGASLTHESAAEPQKSRKRKRKDAHDDLEAKYLSKLTADDGDDAEPKEKAEPSDKRRKGEEAAAVNDEEDDAAPIVHESLLPKGETEHGDVELEKANRTLFLGNVSSEAIADNKAKKTLLAHLAEPLKDLDEATGPHKVESIRFRSVAFSGGPMPKRASFITKSLMSATTKSSNAYAVYSTPLAARAALKALNGSVVLDRHLRVDSVAHPTPVDHRRCVFVGNLGFVDDETVLNTNAEGETTSKKRTKVPADLEEGLWRVFGKAAAGPVESVRVPRDPNTRVGKGFAYVQFQDGNDVEAALLLDGKKFPPLLPRILRVSRAKDPRKTTLAMEKSAKAKLEDGGKAAKGSTKYRPKATPEQQSLAGRAGRLLGRAGAAKQARALRGDKGGKPRILRARNGGETGAEGGMKTPQQIVFEGRRASSKDGKPKDLKFGKTRSKRAPAKPNNRGAKRAAEWRKKGSSS